MDGSAISVASFFGITGLYMLRGWSRDARGANASTSKSSKSGTGSLSSSKSKSKFDVVFVLGGPGSGKGTQCELIIEEFPQFGFFSAGDLLREERKKPGSKVGKMINDKISNGEFVPASVTVELLKQAMITAAENNCKSFIIDGFPRNLDNVEVWGDIMEEVTDVKFCLFLIIPMSILSQYRFSFSLLKCLTANYV